MALLPRATYGEQAAKPLEVCLLRQHHFSEPSFQFCVGSTSHRAPAHDGHDIDVEGVRAHHIDIREVLSEPPHDQCTVVTRVAPAAVLDPDFHLLRRCHESAGLLEQSVAHATDENDLGELG